MKRQIQNLLTNYSIEEIETACVQAFIENAGLEVLNDILLLEIIQNKSKNISEIKTQVEIPKELDDLVKLFELLIPPEDRKLNGAFFTPTLITDFIARELVISEDLRICDPSCGCGAFLIASIRRLREISNKSIKSIIENNIYGVDILEYSIRRCKILISLLAISMGEDFKEFKFNVVCSDSLTANFISLFPHNPSKLFDIVLGNPPYVKYQDLPVQLRSDLYHNWTTLKKGTYNLYFSFFELGVSLLKENGRLGYIVPNNYFTSLAGVELRRYLQERRLIYKIIDFNHKMIFDVQTYTCITFLSRDSASRSCFEYERITEPRLLNQPSSLTYSKIDYNSLNTRKWRVLKDRDRDNITKIETQPNKLGVITNIHVGIATLKDSVYFVDGYTLENGFLKKPYKGYTFQVEESITRYVARISDFKDQESLNKNLRRIIFPYILHGKDVNLISKDVLRNKYPKCYEYLLAAKAELSTRDKGKGEYPEWYAYARTQGLNYYGKKLLTPTFSSKPRFMLDNNTEGLFCNGYAIYLKETTQASLFNPIFNLETLQKIINSKIMEYYAFQTSYTIEGGYPCYQKNFIELFGIPNFGESDIFFLENETCEDSIDRFLIEKYGLSL